MNESKAYVVGGEEYSIVQFARGDDEARRIGSEKMGLEFGDVDSCRRAPELDQYAPGPVSPLTLYRLGWWFECMGCERRIEEGGEYDEWEEIDPVESGGGLYCSPWCRNKDLAETEERKRRAGIAAAHLETRVLKRFPEAKIDSKYAFPRSRNGVLLEANAHVSFYLPISRFGPLRTNMKHMGGHAETCVPQGDLEAFLAFPGRKGPAA